jgi:hypothetical protein
LRYWGLHSLRSITITRLFRFTLLFAAAPHTSPSADRSPAGTSLPASFLTTDCCVDCSIASRCFRDVAGQQSFRPF